MSGKWLPPNYWHMQELQKQIAVLQNELRWELRKAVELRDGIRCHYCGVETFTIPNGVGFSGCTRANRSLDHKTPLSRGGKDELDNVVLACKSCNSRKGTKTYQEFVGRYSTPYLFGGPPAEREDGDGTIRQIAGPVRPPVAQGSPEYSAGMRVRHRLFGEGVVIDARVTTGDEVVRVAFVGQGVKTLLAGFAELDVCEGAV